MAIKPHSILHLLLLIYLFFVLSTATITVGDRKAILVGGWSPIKDVKDPHVQEIGEFAVSEHNRKSGDDLKFSKVLRGESQVVSGTNYRLVVAAADGGARNKYQAVVWEKPWLGFRNLTSFVKV